ncbi:hypothetical protein PHLGIDRAFT_36301 [Phlebiopsis gigantea 11061_1 CR5-6]|uniref:OTU domain-containing protein n=1 Tax=Phlebiopsis gigantea (strain 11061_1 CR5-6) TaxID=745531 RepID=A0A0C3PI84_PHLG1|nr:hypothetical protein PHLGIDRAFT_36301 [Phlebiopsis gigantea 11061_1 CR5-6]
MAHTKRKSAKAAPQLRSRTTRSRGKALADPAENTQMLNEQLRALGLYAAPTLGDGNCLFRALSDQLYGTESYHAKLRTEVCSWIEAHKRRYEPFVDDERGLDVHLQCMRQQATYGGHLELSAFAHMIKRNVKVVQPGLVYIIEWNAGGDPATDSRSPSPAPARTSPAPQALAADDGEKTLTRRERKRLDRQVWAALPPLPPANNDSANATVYVAYHDWEHFSSIRNLRGPHAGLPNVQEVKAADDASPSPPPASPVRRKPVSRASSSKPISKPKSKRLSKPSASEPVVTPSHVPLPLSRSVSPLTEPPSSQPVLPYPLPSCPPSPSRIYHSPKRTFDESSASSESSQSMAKRHKSSSRPSHEAFIADTRSPLGVDGDDGSIDTPPLSLSVPGSPSSLSSLSSISSSSPEATPPPPDRTLTKRERKQLGLPKARVTSAAAAAAKKNSAGKIKIPGGRMQRAAAARDASDAGEWQRNGTGRLDVRGFRELKI